MPWRPPYVVWCYRQITLSSVVSIASGAGAGVSDVTRSSHFTMPNITIIDTRQTARNTPQA